MADRPTRPRASLLDHPELLHICEEVVHELGRASDEYGPFPTIHHGMSVLLEEVDELQEETRKRPGAVDVEAMRTEAIQVAAMAVRFILDLCEPVMLPVAWDPKEHTKSMPGTTDRGMVQTEAKVISLHQRTCYACLKTTPAEGQQCQHCGALVTGADA